MQNTIQNLDYALLFSRNQVFVWKSESFGKLELSYNSIFFAETWHMFSTSQCLQTGAWDFFYFI